MKVRFTLTLVFFIRLFFLALFVRASVPDSLILNITYKQSTPADSLRLYLFDALMYNKKGLCYYPVPKGNKRFRFAIPIYTRAGYFGLTVKRRTTGEGDMDIIKPQFWESGDSVSVNISHTETNAGIHSTLSFNGKGSNKYIICDKLSKIHMEDMVEQGLFSGNLLQQLPLPLPVTQQYQLKFLEQNKSLISPLCYGVFKAGIVQETMNNNLLAVENYYNAAIKNAEKDTKSRFKIAFEKSFFPINPYLIDDIALSYSSDYLVYLTKLYDLGLTISGGQMDKDYIFTKAISTVPGERTLENLLLLMLIKAGSSPSMLPCYDLAAKHIISLEGIADFKEAKSRAQKKMDNYIFTGRDGSNVKISDFSGKVVLIDLWFYGCGGCRMYFKNVLLRLEQDFEHNKKFVVLSVCVDKKIDRWEKAFIDGGYTTSKAINVYTNGLGFNHPVLTTYDISWLPTIMLLDKDSRIKAFDTEELKNYDQLVAAIKKLL